MDSATNGYSGLSDGEVLECSALSAGSDAETALASAISNGYDRLADEQILECAAYAVCDAAGYADAEAALAAAIAAGYDEMSDRQLEEGVLLYLS